MITQYGIRRFRTTEEVKNEKCDTTNFSHAVAAIVPASVCGRWYRATTEADHHNILTDKAIQQSSCKQ